MSRYSGLIASGRLSADPRQAALIKRLQDLHHALLAGRTAEGRGLLARLGLRRNARSVSPRGLYVHGPVGRGKSMAMDLFFESAPLEAKRRVHFHAFMLEVHDRLKELRSTDRDSDAVALLAAQLADDAHLLCFDEFHVQNIADAMILDRLFSGLWQAGTVVVATSNQPPDRLYENGLNRDRFLPFIARLKATLEVVALDGPLDYRLGRLRNLKAHLWPLDAASRAALDAVFLALADDAPGEEMIIPVQSRSLLVPFAARGVARFDFPGLCEAALGAADYLALSRHFHTIILQNVPRFTPEKREAARRFVTLIDILYEKRTRLFLSAEVPPFELFETGESGADFSRTLSRLMEMQSRDYLESGPDLAHTAPAAPADPHHQG